MEAKVALVYNNLYIKHSQEVVTAALFLYSKYTFLRNILCLQTIIKINVFRRYLNSIIRILLKYFELNENHRSAIMSFSISITLLVENFIIYNELAVLRTSMDTFDA